MRKIAQNQIENNIREQEINTFNFVTVVLYRVQIPGVDKNTSNQFENKTKKFCIIHSLS